MDFETIDTVMHGRAGITGAFLVQGRATALIETGPGSSLMHVLAALEQHSVDSLDWIVVTHIHLDHAGAAGALAARFPEATVAVHEVGAPHLVDPTKLWASASRIYGDKMTELWGEMIPIEGSRLRTIGNGDVIDLGGRTLTAIETPGHARHHHSYLDDGNGTIFTGDALGVRLPEVGTIRPATPPPEFNLEDTVASIEKLKSLGADRLCLTHFGPNDAGESADTVEGTCDAAVEAFHLWAEWVQDARRSSRDLDEVTAEVRRRAEAHAAEGMPPDAAERLEQTTSYWMNTWGYMRYFDKKEGA